MAEGRFDPDGADMDADAASIFDSLGPGGGGPDLLGFGDGLWGSEITDLDYLEQVAFEGISDSTRVLGTSIARGPLASTVTGGGPFGLVAGLISAGRATTTGLAEIRSGYEAEYGQEAVDAAWGRWATEMSEAMGEPGMLSPDALDRMTLGDVQAFGDQLAFESLTPEQQDEAVVRAYYEPRSTGMRRDDFEAWVAEEVRLLQSGAYRHDRAREMGLPEWYQDYLQNGSRALFDYTIPTGGTDDDTGDTTTDTGDTPIEETPVEETPTEEAPMSQTPVSVSVGDRSFEYTPPETAEATESDTGSVVETTPGAESDARDVPTRRDLLRDLVTERAMDLVREPGFQSTIAGQPVSLRTRSQRDELEAALSYLLDENKLVELERQFDETMAENVRQFDLTFNEDQRQFDISSSIDRARVGVAAQANAISQARIAESGRQFDIGTQLTRDQMAEDTRRFELGLELDQDRLAEDTRRFDLGFEEDQRQFDLGLEQGYFRLSQDEPSFIDKTQQIIGIGSAGIALGESLGLWDDGPDLLSGLASAVGISL